MFRRVLLNPKTAYYPQSMRPRSTHRVDMHFSHMTVRAPRKDDSPGDSRRSRRLTSAHEGETPARPSCLPSSA